MAVLLRRDIDRSHLQFCFSTATSLSRCDSVHENYKSEGIPFPKMCRCPKVPSRILQATNVTCTGVSRLTAESGQWTRVGYCAVAARAVRWTVLPVCVARTGLPDSMLISCRAESPRGFPTDGLRVLGTCSAESRRYLICGARHLPSGELIVGRESRHPLPLACESPS